MFKKAEKEKKSIILHVFLSSTGWYSSEKKVTYLPLTKRQERQNEHVTMISCWWANWPNRIRWIRQMRSRHGVKFGK